MNVKTILAAKNLGGDVICIEPTADLASAAELTPEATGCRWTPGADKVK